MLWAACTTAFFGFCRSGEITVECESKFTHKFTYPFLILAIDNALQPQVISINMKLKHYKTDQFMKGVKLVIGRANNYLYPVTALLSYPSHGNSPGPLFQWDDQRPLSGMTKTIIQVKICQSHPSSTLSCKHPILPLYRSQFSYRSSNNSCLSRHRELYNSNPWTIARFSLTYSTSGSPGYPIIYNATSD